MNICFLSIGHISKQRGGIDRVTDIISKALIERGHNVSLISLWSAVEGDKIEEYQHFLPSQDCVSTQNREFLKEFFINNKIQVIINQAETDSMLELISCTHGNIPIITCIHTDPMAAVKTTDDNLDLWRIQSSKVQNIAKTPYFYLRYLYQRYTRRKHLSRKYHRLYNTCDAIVLLSNKFFNSFKITSDITDCKKLYAISNPRAIKVQEHKLDEKENIVLFVGRLVFQKRLDRLFKIWNRIKDKKDWKLVIIGDGPDRSFYETLCRKWNVENVEFIGQCDPEPFYRKAKILCMTSSYEGSPCVIQEALQNCIIPIAFESFESITDTIINNKNGFLIKPFSIKQYTICLKELINNQEELRRFQRYIESSNQEEHGYNCKILESWENLITVICAKNETSN